MSETLNLTSDIHDAIVSSTTFIVLTTSVDAKYLSRPTYTIPVTSSKSFPSNKLQQRHGYGGYKDFDGYNSDKSSHHLANSFTHQRQ